MSVIVPVSVITLDGFQYAVVQETYSRSWVREFTFNISAVVIQVNFVDRGPGVRKYNMTLWLETWPNTSLPFKQGVTQTVSQQLTNLEASYNKVTTPLSYTDPFGIQPISGGVVTGEYFTNLTQKIPKVSTPQYPVVTYEIELMDATSEVTG